MQNGRVERRLAAIMATDIVAYSRLIETDEARTLTAIRALRSEVVDPLIADHRGRIVKLMGDGAIVEFVSVVDAVTCAIAVQERATAISGRSRPRAASCSASASTSETLSWRSATSAGTASTLLHGLKRWRNRAAFALLIRCRNSWLARLTSPLKIPANAR